MATVESLPVRPVSRQEWTHAANPTLRIDGLVARPLALTPADLAGLRRAPFAGAFHCDEGWGVPNLRWEGWRLVDVVALADPLDGARYVRVAAGPYAVPVALDDLDVVLCDALDGHALTVEHGGPWRLIVPGEPCFTSVKWVDRLDVTAEPGEHTAERPVRQRRRASAQRQVGQAATEG